MSSTKKKRKTNTTKNPSLNPSPVLSPTPELTPNLSLPDDLLVSCFARISRLHYPALSLVSKRFRSLLASPELYQTRSLLSRTESCLFVCFEFSRGSNQRWFTLCRKPNQTLTNSAKRKKKSSGYVLAPIPVPHSLQAPQEERLVAVDFNIYVIGGPIDGPFMPSSSVSILDCRSYRWLPEAPSMKMERCYPKPTVFDGKIYVAGGCKDYDSSNWMEVFDPKTQTWELVSSPLADRSGSSVHRTAAIEGKIVMGGDKSVAYKPEEDKWEVIEDINMNTGWVTMSYCTIDNVLYSFSRSGIKWYDFEIRYWMDVKGLESLPKVAGYALKRLVDYGGKMVLLWDKFLPSSSYKERVIWCAVISLEKRNNNQEIWGNIEWLDGVLTVPKSYDFLGAVSATV